MSTDEPARDGRWTVLEQDQRFSRSVLWRLQRTYYDRQGPRAWHDREVPNDATCNTYLAAAYAEVVIAYLHELVRTGKLVATAPVHVVELGAGVGAFAAYFLRALDELRRASSLRDLDVRYVMTDFTPSNLRRWGEHPQLRPLVDDGRLAFGTFDVDADDAIALADGAALGPGSCANPVVIVANYAFDAFRQELFRVHAGALQEVRVTTRAPGDGPVDLARLDLLATLRTQYRYQDVDAAGYHGNPIHDQLLAAYQARLVDTTFTMPVVGLDAVERLLALAGGRGLLLSSDKGYTQADELDHRAHQPMQLHAGCFSMMVNYHAIGSYFEARGGVYAATSRRALNLKTALCVRGDAGDDFVDTVAMFRRRFDEFGPGELYEYLELWRAREAPLDQFLALLRLSGYDPGLFHQRAELVRRQCHGITDALSVELRVAIDRVWANYFAGLQNLPYELGRVLLALDRPHEAARFHHFAIDWYGESPAACLSLGACYYHAEDPAQALRWFQRARNLQPDLAVAHQWIARIEAEGERAAARTFPAP
ncbi:MAG: hypothetical protein KC464_06190, partial [Myxococcales bacterium]|nr:hypothetical protein [Myxococcales bacterium]